MHARLLGAALLTLGASAAFAAEPCCSVISIDPRTGEASARVNASGVEFDFRAPNPRAVRVGQAIYANLPARKVSLDGRSACCAISAVRAAAETRAQASPAPPSGRAIVEASPAPAAPAATPAPVATPPSAAPSPPAKASPGRGLGSLGRPASRVVRLKDYEKAAPMMQAVGAALSAREIDVTLLAGRKYMINNCFGIKASAGKFRMRLANPRFSIDEDGARLTFGIDRIGMSALKLRMRPRSDVLHPCKFGKSFEVGGSAKNVRVEVRLDPRLDLERCRLGNIGKVRAKFRIGNLNLKPLQNDLDRMAKDMVEDSMTWIFENLDSGAGTNQVIQTMNDILEADCPAKNI